MEEAVSNEPKRALSSGVKKYMEFHDLEPNRIGKFGKGVKIPARAYKLGKAKEVFYHSKKWNDPANYKHEHSAGVGTYSTNPRRGYREVAVPKWFRSCKVLVRLGDCLGYTYEDEHGELQAHLTPGGGPSLYCTSNGKGLVVVSNGKIRTLIWGGKLGVEARGIVH